MLNLNKFILYTDYACTPRSGPPPHIIWYRFVGSGLIRVACTSISGTSREREVSSVGTSALRWD